MRNHVAIEVLVIPDWEPKSDCREQYRIDASNVRQDVKDCVAIPSHNKKVLAQLEWYLNYRIWEDLKGSKWHHLYFENTRVAKFSDFIQIYVQVLQVKLRLFNDKWDVLLDGNTVPHPLDSALLHDWLSSVFGWIEANFVSQEQQVLALQELSDFFLTFANVLSNAFYKLYLDILTLIWVELAAHTQFVLIHTLEVVCILL